MESKMSDITPLFRKVEGSRIAFWCPGCDESHVIGIGAGGWTWDEASLTVSPSIKVTGVQWYPGDHFYNANHRVEPRQQTCCHSFIRDGVWEFLADSTHTLAGQNVPVVKWPSDKEADDGE